MLPPGPPIPPPIMFEFIMLGLIKAMLLMAGMPIGPIPIPAAFMFIMLPIAPIAPAPITP